MRPPAGSHEHYDSVSRAVHWLMFLLFAWIYCSAITHYLASDSTLDKWLWPFHKPVGLLLLVLLILRAGWRLLNQHRRPLSISRFAAAGHGMLYALMFLIPLIGMIRQYGSGRAFSAFGVPVMEGFEGKKSSGWLIWAATFIACWVGQCWCLSSGMSGRWSCTIGRAISRYCGV